MLALPESNDNRADIYWRWWSDWMVHKIHLRVFEHIKEVAEKELSEISSD